MVLDGEMSERFKEPVLKTGDAATHRGFESHSLRQIERPLLTQLRWGLFAYTNIRNNLRLTEFPDFRKKTIDKLPCPCYYIQALRVVAQSRR